MRDPPTGTVPSEQGNAKTQAPLLDTKVRPEGVAAETETPAASDTPALLTVRVYTTVLPGVTLVGPLWAMDRSADAATVEEADALLLEPVGSAS